MDSKFLLKINRELNEGEKLRLQPYSIRVHIEITALYIGYCVFVIKLFIQQSKNKLKCILCTRVENLVM